MRRQSFLSFSRLAQRFSTSTASAALIVHEDKRVQQYWQYCLPSGVVLRQVEQTE
jgi:hypothetical protein